MLSSSAYLTLYLLTYLTLYLLTYLTLFSLADDADKGETSVSSCHERCGTLAVSLDVRQIERLLLDEASVTK